MSHYAGTHAPGARGAYLPSIYHADVHSLHAARSYPRKRERMHAPRKTEACRGKINVR